MSKENGFEFTPKEGGIGMPDQKSPPYEPFSTGEKMRRGKNPRVFDNNGGNSKAGSAGVVNHNDNYGPVTYGY
jgi:hypothetical protein